MISSGSSSASAIDFPVTQDAASRWHSMAATHMLIQSTMKYSASDEAVSAFTLFSYLDGARLFTLKLGQCPVPIDFLSVISNSFAPPRPPDLDGDLLSKHLKFSFLDWKNTTAAAFDVVRPDDLTLNASVSSTTTTTAVVTGGNKNNSNNKTHQKQQVITTDAMDFSSFFVEAAREIEQLVDHPREYEFRNASEVPRDTPKSFGVEGFACAVFWLCVVLQSRAEEAQRRDPNVPTAASSQSAFSQRHLFDAEVGHHVWQEALLEVLRPDAATMAHASFGDLLVSSSSAAAAAEQTNNREVKNVKMQQRKQQDIASVDNNNCSNTFSLSRTVTTATNATQQTTTQPGKQQNCQDNNNHHSVATGGVVRISTNGKKQNFDDNSGNDGQQQQQQQQQNIVIVEQVSVNDIARRVGGHLKPNASAVLALLVRGEAPLSEHLEAKLQQSMDSAIALQDALRLLCVQRAADLDASILSDLDKWCRRRVALWVTERFSPLAFPSRSTDDPIRQHFRPYLLRSFFRVVATAVARVLTRIFSGSCTGGAMTASVAWSKVRSRAEAREAQFRQHHQQQQQGNTKSTRHHRSSLSNYSSSSSSAARSSAASFVQPLEVLHAELVRVNVEKVLLELASLPQHYASTITASSAYASLSQSPRYKKMLPFPPNSSSSISLLATSASAVNIAGGDSSVSSSYQSPLLSTRHRVQQPKPPKTQSKIANHCEDVPAEGAEESNNNHNKNRNSNDDDFHHHYVMTTTNNQQAATTAALKSRFGVNSREFMRETIDRDRISLVRDFNELKTVVARQDSARIQQLLHLQGSKKKREQQNANSPTATATAKEATSSINFAQEMLQKRRQRAFQDVNSSLNDQNTLIVSNTNNHHGTATSSFVVSASSCRSPTRTDKNVEGIARRIASARATALEAEIQQRRQRRRHENSSNNNNNTVLLASSSAASSSSSSTTITSAISACINLNGLSIGVRASLESPDRFVGAHFPVQPVARMLPLTAREETNVAVRHARRRFAVDSSVALTRVANIEAEIKAEDKDEETTRLLFRFKRQQADQARADILHGVNVATDRQRAQSARARAQSAGSRHRMLEQLRRDVEALLPVSDVHKRCSTTIRAQEFYATLYATKMKIDDELSGKCGTEHSIKDRQELRNLAMDVHKLVCVMVRNYRDIVSEWEEFNVVSSSSSHHHGHRHDETTDKNNRNKDTNDHYHTVSLAKMVECGAIHNQKKQQKT